jgi:hypothetical protein
LRARWNRPRGPKFARRRRKEGLGSGIRPGLVRLGQARMLHHAPETLIPLALRRRRACI